MSGQIGCTEAGEPLEDIVAETRRGVSDLRLTPWLLPGTAEAAVGAVRLCPPPAAAGQHAVAMAVAELSQVTGPVLDACFGRQSSGVGRAR